MGNLQFVLYRGLFRGRGLQVLNIFGQRVLHILEGVTQLAYLIPMLDSRQQGVKLSLSHLVGCVCQKFQGHCSAPDDEEAHEEGDHQHDDDNKQDDDANHHGKKI